MTSSYRFTLDGRIRYGCCSNCKKQRSVNATTKLCSDCERLLVKEVRKK